VNTNASKFYFKRERPVVTFSRGWPPHSHPWGQILIRWHSCADDTRRGNGRPLQIDGDAALALRTLMSAFNNIEIRHV